MTLDEPAWRSAKCLAVELRVPITSVLAAVAAAHIGDGESPRRLGSEPDVTLVYHPNVCERVVAALRRSQ